MHAREFRAAFSQITFGAGLTEIYFLNAGTSLEVRAYVAPP